MFKDTAKNLEILAEECAEVIQAKSKIVRFGWDSSYLDGTSNKTALEREIGDLLAMVDILCENETISRLCIAEYKQAKREKLKRWY